MHFITLYKSILHSLFALSFSYHTHTNTPFNSLYPIYYIYAYTFNSGVIPRNAAYITETYTLGALDANSDIEKLVISGPSNDFSRPTSRIYHPLTGLTKIPITVDPDPNRRLTQSKTGARTGTELVSKKVTKPPVFLLTSVWAQSKSDPDVHPHRLEVLAALVANLHNPAFAGVHVVRRQGGARINGWAYPLRGGYIFFF